MDTRNIKIRVVTSYASLGTTGRFYIVVGTDGSVLARIRGARHAEEARAWFWRGRGLSDFAGSLNADALAGASGMERAIAMARAGRTSLPQLPLDGGESAARVARAPSGGRAVPNDLVMQPDLFASPADISATPDGVPVQDAQREAPAPVRHLTPEEAPVSRIQYQGIRATDREDSYLYWVATPEDERQAVTEGLSFSPSAPLLLTERPGAAYFLSLVLDDDMAPEDVALLRIRRYLVETLLEPDADTSRRAGAMCYLLTGGP